MELAPSGAAPPKLIRKCPFGNSLIGFGKDPWRQSRAVSPKRISSQVGNGYRRSRRSRAELKRIQYLHSALRSHPRRGGRRNTWCNSCWQRPRGKGLVGVEELGAVGELEDAAHVVGGAGFHSSDEKADGAAKLRSWLGPSGEAVGGVEAKLDADVGAGGGGDRVLGDLNVVGIGELAGGDDIDGGGGGLGGVGLAGGGDGDDQAGRAWWRGVIAGGVDGAGGSGGAGTGVGGGSERPGNASGIAGGGEGQSLADGNGGCLRGQGNGNGDGDWRCRIR